MFMQFHEIISNTIFIFTRPLDPEKITKSYALFEHMHFTNYTFFITSKNDKGTANSTSQVFVPSYEKGTYIFFYQTKSIRFFLVLMYTLVFRAIFDLSNKIALLILL